MHGERRARAVERALVRGARRCRARARRRSSRPASDSARANARALSMPCGVALRLPTIASAGRVQQLDAGRRRYSTGGAIGRVRAAPADSRRRPTRSSSWPGCASQSRVRASASAGGGAASCAATPSGTTAASCARVAARMRLGPPNARSSATMRGGGSARSASAAQAVGARVERHRDDEPARPSRRRPMPARRRSDAGRRRRRHGVRAIVAGTRPDPVVLSSDRRRTRGRTCGTRTAAPCAPRPPAGTSCGVTTSSGRRSAG